MIDPPQPVSTRREPSPWTVAFVVLLVTVLSFGLVAQLIGIAVGYLFYGGGGFMQYAEDLQNLVVKDGMKTSLMVAQAITTVLGLAVIPPIFWWSMRRKSLWSFFNQTPVRPVDLLYVIGIVIFFMGLNSVVIEWNQNIQYPGEFGVWAREVETKAEELTKLIANFSNVGEYLVAVLVIGVFASIGEELVFRGLIQTELQKAFKNPHAAIWVAAIFFSAFHLQFYGFFPRVLLGAVLGYLYYWSGNLAVPMFAHFINNIVAVSALYFGLESIDEKPEALPWYIVVGSTIICAFLIYRYRANHTPPNDQPA